MASRVTQVALEVLRSGGTTNARVTQVAAEVLRSVDPAGAHRYWRLNFTTAGPADHVAIEEVEFFTSLGGVDVTGSGTAAASTELSTPTYAADKAFDNSQSTFWHTGSTSMPQQLSYDFGADAPKAVVAVSLRCSTNGPDYMPRAFDVQYSDDNSSWTTLFSVTDTNWPGGTTTTQHSRRRYGLASVGGGTADRYAFWRIHMTGKASTTFGLREAAFRTVAGGASVAVDGVGWANTQFDDTTYAATNAFDGASTNWSAGASQATEDLTYSFIQPFKIVEVALTSRGDGGSTEYGQAPSDFSVQYSTDGITWVTRAAFVGVTWTANSQTKTFDITLKPRRSVCVT